MNDTFKLYLRKFIIVFFNDILIYNKSFDDHLHHLAQTFQLLQDHQFYLKLSKCSFAQQQVECLGHIVFASGVALVQDKVVIVQQWPIPNSFKALRGFLGLTGFYRRFIRRYSAMATPLTHLLTKEHLEWPEEAQLAFQQLKEAVSTVPILPLPNFSSGTGMGVILSEDGHSIVFFSKQFYPKLLHASTYFQELYVITATIKKWRQYLLGHSFVILMDHGSLKELMAQFMPTPEQQKYLLHLMGYDFTIQYRSSRTIVVADALLRIPEFSSGIVIIVNASIHIFVGH